MTHGADPTERAVRPPVAPVKWRAKCPGRAKVRIVVAQTWFEARSKACTLFGNPDPASLTVTLV